MYSTHRVNTVGLPNWMQRRKEPQLMWKWSSNLSQPGTGGSLHYHNTSPTLRVPGIAGGGMNWSHAQTQASSGVIKGRGESKNSLSWTEDVTYQEVGRVPSQLNFASLHFFSESLVPKQQIWCHPHVQHANQTMSFHWLGFCKCPYFFFSSFSFFLQSSRSFP